MKISCEIIKDLLPLYYDKACSNESRELIEEHLQECEDCTAELQAMGEELFVTNTEENLKEAEVVRKISLKWKKGMLASLLKGILMTIIVTIVFVLILSIFVGIRIVPSGSL